MELALEPGQSLVLFDGECAVCDASMLFIMDRDPTARFVFAPLQSDLGQRFLREHAPELVGRAETMVLYDGTQVHTHSNAVLRIASQLSGPIKLVAGLMAIPRPLRDAAYRAFAARRLRWFGRVEQCRVPTPEMRKRLLA